MVMLATNRSLKQHYHKWPRVERIAFLILVTFLITAAYATCDWDPYQVLGVRRDASLEQIKKAYRELARKWHPDKSNTSEDESERKFIELNKAFDILKDPAKRSHYDQHGEIDESRHSRGYHQGGSFNDRVPRNGWSYHNGYRTFTFYTTSQDNFFKKKSITSQQYYNEYVVESKRRPFLIFFYVDLCRTCFMIESEWIKSTEKLAKFNVGTFSINLHREPHLAHELGVSSIPHIACLIDGQIYHYHQSEISLPSLVRFIKNSLPNNLLPLLKSESEQDRHIATSFQKNRLSAIIIDNENIVKLRYLILAYALRDHYSFGYISEKQSDTKAIFERFKITGDSRPRLLVFNEQFDRPIMEMDYHHDDLNTAQLTRQLLEWPHLKLPRLSSQQKFDELCLFWHKVEGYRKRPTLCAILFASATPSSQPVREKMIEFIDLNGLDRDGRVVIAYVDPDKQNEFVTSLLLETNTSQPQFVKDSIHSSVILIERHPIDHRKAQHVWIQNRWDPKRPNELDKAKIELYQYIEAYKQGVYRPTMKLALLQLVDEEGPSLWQRIYSRSISVMSRLAHYFTSRESLSAVLILIACAIVTSLFLYKSPVPNQYNGLGSDFANYRSTPDPQEGTSEKKSRSAADQLGRADDLKIIELKAETYNGMVRLLRPGYRSIIVLTDQKTKDKLLANFRNAVWPYRRNKTLLFGYLCLDKNLAWYKALLEEVLYCENLKVNKNNCIGTVLSLNGFKKYLRVYHAKHHEIDTYDNSDNDGSFLGFDEREDDLETGIRSPGENEGPMTEAACTTENLLDKLPIWLDKMFDGLTKRYFLEQWPEEIN